MSPFLLILQTQDNSTILTEEIEKKKHIKFKKKKFDFFFDFFGKKVSLFSQIKKCDRYFKKNDKNE